ncbi:MAG: RNA polymerase sigma factor [Gemmatimonadales bacterium]|nr:MAG: RNA polymerase sigma factor [Gemmatimonadales bacterium]
MGIEGDPGEDSDEELARRIQRGDRAALERLVRRYVRPVHTVVASFLDERADIEDAAQETFLRIVASMDRYDPARPFAPWLYEIARNVARSWSSAAVRSQLRDTVGPELESPTPGPDLLTERAEIRARVEAGVASLPEQRRIAFRMVDIEGMSAVETAKFMGVSSGTVRSHLHHARRELRATLAEYYEATGNEGGPSHDR